MYWNTIESTVFSMWVLESTVFLMWVIFLRPSRLGWIVMHFIIYTHETTQYKKYVDFLHVLLIFDLAWFFYGVPF